ncbi:UvrD-helicase domain-containing protein [Vibrio sp. TRT 29B02]|uniref:UvrD-helicase domain-containing protein n=1 Tax=Vibrio sp. TRT 29B02 TaxID=3418508 RepID=UPI003CE8B70A
MNFKGYKLSPEQMESLSAFVNLPENKLLVIDAGAGASKTFTCNAIVSNLCAQLRVLVLAYNSIIVEEMKDAFPNNCDVTTSHSFARKHTKPYREERLNTPLTIRVVQNILKLPSKIDSMGSATFSEKVLKIINKYCVSDASSISEFMALNMTNILNVHEYSLKEELVRNCKILWAIMTDRESSCPITHDVYLKEFVLLLEAGEVTIDYDVVVLDEGQDTVPVVKQMFELLNAKGVIVGDKYQSIYEWRNAVNVMESYIKSNNVTTRLTTCYRFGQPIANVANALIEKYYGTNPQFKGNPDKKSVIHSSANHEPHDQSLMLFRTNAELMSSLIEKFEAGYKCKLLKKAEESLKLIDDAQELRNGNKVLRGALRVFNNWQEFEEHARSTQGGEFKSFINSIELYGFDKMRTVISQAAETPKESAQYIFATAHSTKGIEHDNVVIGPDFDKFISRSSGKLLQQEASLLYVALTRAKSSLDISQCSTLRYLADKPIKEKLSSSVMQNKHKMAAALFG